MKQLSAATACWLIAFAAAAIIGVAAPPQNERTASWYTDHPSVLEKVTRLCRNDPGHAARNPDCMNASQAQVLVALREAEHHNSGNLTPPSDPHYWPLHPQEWSYRLFVCDRLPEDAKAANWCPAAYAAKAGAPR
jgi:hypothetical protein